MSYSNYPIYQNMYQQPYQDRLTQLQNQYQQTIPQMQSPQPQINQGLLWVQGEAGAKSYLVAPSTTVLLMDSESQRFYLKSTDSSGMPNLRTFEYAEVQNTPKQAMGENLDDKYVTRNEYNSLLQRYDELLNKLDAFRANDSVDSAGKRQGKPERKGGNVDEQSDI